MKLSTDHSRPRPVAWLRAAENLESACARPTALDRDKWLNDSRVAAKSKLPHSELNFSINECNHTVDWTFNYRMQLSEHFRKKDISESKANLCRHNVCLFEGSKKEVNIRQERNVSNWIVRLGVREFWSKKIVSQKVIGKITIGLLKFLIHILHWKNHLGDWKNFFYPFHIFTIDFFWKFLLIHICYQPKSLFFWSASRDWFSNVCYGLKKIFFW